MRKLFYVLMISITVLIFSCEKNSKLGYDILPEGDILNMQITDTFSILTYTESVDSLVTSGIDEMLLGEYIDPVFGYSKASFVCQLTDIYKEKQIVTEDIIDSIIFTMPLNFSDDSLTYYGNNQTELTIRVYRLTEPVHPVDGDTTFYQNHIPVFGALLGETTLTPIERTPNDSVLSINIVSSFGTELMNADSSVFEDGDDFRDFFNGLYVESQSAGGDASIIKFNLNSDFKITVYWKDFDNESSIEEYDLIANNSSNIRFNIFEHDYSGYDIENLIDQETQDSVVFIQAGGGLRCKIEIPNIDKLKDIDNIVIHRAELLLKVPSSNYTDEDDYPAIGSLAIKYLYDESSLQYIYEYLGVSGYYGEQYTDGIYKFDILSYIQDVLDGNIENEGLVLYHYDENENMERSVIRSGSNTIPMKLIVTYATY